MISIRKLKPGMTVWHCLRHKAGNTTMYTYSNYKVRIMQVNEKSVVASWNGNEPRKYVGQKFGWFDKEPVLVKSGWVNRKATKAEIAAMKGAK